VSSEKIVTIDTIPGWTHDITNTGKEELIVLLWANEIFDEKAPDTYYRKT
jgi:UDP-2-acetamido-2,6-beta-L-arabino-hexul-4-ose reductase